MLQRRTWTSSIPRPELWALVLEEVGKTVVKIETVSGERARVRYFPDASEAATHIGRLLESRHSKEFLWAEMQVKSHAHGASLDFRLFPTRGACFALLVTAALTLGAPIIIFSDAVGTGSIVRWLVAFTLVLLVLGLELLVFRVLLRHISNDARILREPFDRIVSIGKARQSMMSRQIRGKYG